MTLVINALDNQFAVATGTNVNSSPGQSKFDYPPSSTTNLVIESKPGDPSPYIFSPGDTYSLSFSGNGGTTIENATVLRSDYVNWDGDTGYVVVFEGLDANGDVAQVVWTPEFDLEAFYWNNFVNGQPPEFYTTDQSTASTYQMVCFEQSTAITTPQGPKTVSDLKPGDLVTTFTRGPQPITWITSRRVTALRKHAPVEFAPGAVGNTVPLRLSQQHRILVNHKKAAESYRTREVLVPALSFINGDTIRIRPQPWIAYTHFMLDAHDIVLANDVPCETLLMGPVTLDALDPGLAEALSPLGSSGTEQPVRKALTVRQGHELLMKIKGPSLERPRMLLTPGRKNMRPYKLPLDLSTYDAGALRPYASICGQEAHLD